MMPVVAMDPGAFVTPRLYVSESTIERLAVLLQARTRGMLLLSDELASLFLNMGRYSKGSDKEFWLEAWNGHHYVVERMGRPPVTIDHLLIGVTGGLQPDKLARSFQGDSDGMHARLLFAWPEEPAFQQSERRCHRDRAGAAERAWPDRRPSGRGGGGGVRSA